MTTRNNDGNANQGAAGEEAIPAGAISGSVIASARQLQEAISRFAQEYEAHHERVAALTQNSGGEPGGEASSPQTTPGESIAEQARDAAQELQGIFSGLFQEDQRLHENLSRSMDRPSDQLAEHKREIGELRRETDRLRDLIRNYRNW